MWCHNNNIVYKDTTLYLFLSFSKGKGRMIGTVIVIIINIIIIIIIIIIYNYYYYTMLKGREVSRCCGCPLCCSFRVGASHRDNLMHLSPLDRIVQEK